MVHQFLVPAFFLPSLKRKPNKTITPKNQLIEAWFTLVEAQPRNCSSPKPGGVVGMLRLIENLYWLKRAGRLNIFSSLLGGMLDVKPVIGLRHGKLVPLTKDRGHEAALGSVAQRAYEDYQRHRGECDIWIAHAEAEDKRDRLLEELRQVMPMAVDHIQIADIGPTMTAHDGPGCIALSVMPT